MNFVEILGIERSDNLRLPTDMKRARECLREYGANVLAWIPPPIDPMRFPNYGSNSSAGKPRHHYEKQPKTKIPYAGKDREAPIAARPEPPALPPEGYTQPGKRALKEILAEAVRNTAKLQKEDDDENR